MKRLICLALALVMVLSLGTAVFASGEASANASGEASAEASGEAGAEASGEASGSPSGEATPETLPEDRVCGHTYSYRLQEDSFEATDTAGGYRHYRCAECGAEYAYATDPMVYADGFVKQNGEIVEVNETNEGAANPYLPLWEHIADGEPHVFWSKADCEWRLYVFGSHDTTGRICGNDYVTWSAPVYDLSDWRYEGETLRINVEEEAPAEITAEASEEAPEEAAEEPPAEASEEAPVEAQEEVPAEAPEEASEEAPAEGSEASAEARPAGGFGMGGRLFAPDCCYDANTDAFYMISYDNSVGLCNVYRATEANADYGALDDIVFRITLGAPDPEQGLYGGSDPAIFFEDGVMYVCSNGDAGTAEKQGDPEITAEVGEYKSVITTSGRVSIAMLYQVEEKDGVWQVTDHSYLPIAGSQYHFFPMEEATSLRKDEETGYYILVYNGGGGTRADGVVHHTTGMSYAYTTDLMGEWHYGENGFGDDVIQDNHGHYLRDANGEMQLTDKETMCANNDSNHGGVVKVNGRWYIFGHINTSNGCRQGIAEQIELVYRGGELFIAATEETSSGFADNLDAYAVWDAGIACYRTPATSVKAVGYLGNHGVTEPPEIDFDVAHVAPMRGLVDGAVIGYKYLDFGSGAASTSLNLLVRQEEGYTDGAVEVWLDAPSAEEGGTKLGTVAVTADAIAAAENTEEGTDGTVWSWLSAEMDAAVSGERGVYFVFSAETEDTAVCLLDQFSFSK